MANISPERVELDLVTLRQVLTVLTRLEEQANDFYESKAMARLTSQLHQVVTTVEGLKDPEPTTAVGELEFMECMICRSQPGSPILCRSCFHNRNAISELRRK